MTTSSAKLCWGRAVGAYLRQDRVILTELASTLTGTLVVRRHGQKTDGSSPGGVLKQWLEAHLTPRQRRHTPVCVGIAAEQAFFTTRFLDAEQRKRPLSPEALLESSGEFRAWSKEGAAADCIGAKLPGGSGYSLAAVKREVAEDVLSNLQAAGVRASWLEPAPWSLLTAADRQAKPPKGWKVIIRVLLTDADGLAMLVVADQPVLWRRFAPDAGSPARSITSAIRALLIYARRSFDIRQIQGVFLQGPVSDELAAQVTDETGLTVAAARSEGPTDEQYSLALALSAKGGKNGTLDLMRGLRPPPSIREIFPWKLGGLILFLGGCMAFLLWNRSASLASQCEAIERQNLSHAWARSLETRAINDQRGILSAEVGAVRKFLSTRIIWSDYLRDLPTRLPTNACLTNVDASCELAEASNKKQNRRASESMTLRGMARFRDRAEAPKEIDTLLESLRDMEMLKRDFPSVQLAEIRWRKEGRSEIAIFTILALPGKSNRPE